MGNPLCQSFLPLPNKQNGWDQCCSWKHRYHYWGPDFSSSFAPQQQLIDCPTWNKFACNITAVGRRLLSQDGQHCCKDAVPKKTTTFQPDSCLVQVPSPEKLRGIEPNLIFVLKETFKDKLTSTPLWQGTLESSRSQARWVSWPGQSAQWSVPISRVGVCCLRAPNKTSWRPARSQFSVSLRQKPIVAAQARHDTQELCAISALRGVKLAVSCRRWVERPPNQTNQASGRKRTHQARAPHLRNCRKKGAARVTWSYLCYFTLLHVASRLCITSAASVHLVEPTHSGHECCIVSGCLFVGKCVRSNCPWTGTALSVLQACLDRNSI